MTYETTQYLVHHGIKGMHWYERRFQNPDGTLTAEGRKRYAKDTVKLARLEKKESKAQRNAQFYKDHKIATVLLPNGALGAKVGLSSVRAKINKYKYDIEMLEKVADKQSIDEIKSYDTGAKGYLANKMWDYFTKDEAGDGYEGYATTLYKHTGGKYGEDLSGQEERGHGIKGQRWDTRRFQNAQNGIAIVDKKGNVVSRAKVTGYDDSKPPMTTKTIRDLAMDKNEKARYKKYFGKNMDDMDDIEFAEEFSKYNAVAERASERMNPSVIEGWNQGYPGYEKKYNDEFNRLFDEEAKKRRK